MAMVSDAGTPLISDPGRRLARAALDAGFRVEAVPGASAVLAALVASGMADDAFTFAGFPPARSKARKQWYAELASEPRPVVFFEAPHRIRASLADLETVSARRTVAVCREMTKLHESLVVGPIHDVLAGLQNPRGEFTVVLARAPVSGPPAEVPAEADLLREFWRVDRDPGCPGGRPFARWPPSTTCRAAACTRRWKARGAGIDRTARPGAGGRQGHPHAVEPAEGAAPARGLPARRARPAGGRPTRRRVDDARRGPPGRGGRARAGRQPRRAAFRSPGAAARYGACGSAGRADTGGAARHADRPDG